MNLLPAALMPLFPKVNDAVRTGSVTVEVAKQAWASMAGQFRPAPTVVVLYGSVAVGNAKPYSDIDLLLVSELGNQIIRRHVCFDGYLFDITIFPQRAARSIAMEASRSLGPGRITAFLNGLPIAGDGELFTRIKAEVADTYVSKIGNESFLLASMERNLLGMLADSCCQDDDDIARCTRQEAKFVALNILSVREFGELLPPTIMLAKAERRFRAILLSVLDHPVTDRTNFAEFIVETVGFQEIKGWES